jgi:hypothetical protein
MSSEAQREASRTNGAKSRGPTTPEGKNISKFNGVKHGLRAEQVVLPGEDPAEFEAERQGWLNDWKPQSHTRAVLVERAAVASWRLRRAVRVESARLRQLTQDAADRFDRERFASVDSAVEQLAYDPKGGLTRLRFHAAGIDRLIASWTELADALAHGPAAWNQVRYHERLMLLLGRYTDDDPAAAGPLPRTSARLLAANVPDSKVHPHPLPAELFESAALDLRGLIAESIAELTTLRHQADDPDVLRKQAADAAIDTASIEMHLRHRYEMAHDQSLRATINQLTALEKSGGDLGDCDPYPESTKEDASKESKPDPVAEAVAPGSLGAWGPGWVPTGEPAAIGGSNGSAHPARAGGGGGSQR